MGRLALTLWFALATLPGQGLCCCSFASATHDAAGDRSSAAPAKSCCDRHAPPCRSGGKHNREPSKPSKCPCEKGKQVNTLPPAGTATTDLAAQLKLIDALFVGLTAPFVIDLGAIASVAADASPPFARLAGRDLLAAYSLLRC